MFQTKFIEKIKTHFIFSKLFPQNHAVYEIMWKNIVQRGWPQMTIWRMRIACWMPKATHHTHTYTLIMINIAFPRQQWLDERASILRYTALCLANIFKY